MFGTCAGMILISDRVTGQKQGGQTLIGGLDVTISRNHFGAQVASFATELDVNLFGEDQKIKAVFIRAPAITDVGKDVEVIAKFNNLVVAVKQGNILATAFHPELTDDTRWHEYFVNIIKKSK